MQERGNSMTCVIGLIDKKSNKIYIGADSIGKADDAVAIRADEKVFIKDKFIIGFTSSYRMGQLLRYKLKIPEYSNGKTVFEYMVTDFVDAVRTCLKDGGFASKDKETECGGSFLIGFKGRLFVIESDYQVEEVRLPFNAVGSGADIAKGVMYSTETYYPKTRIISALKAAGFFLSSVRRPFIIKSIKIESEAK
ncbi:MAG: hypothetical protein V1709_00850 [Planctomycetota bacterium]